MEILKKNQRKILFSSSVLTLNEVIKQYQLKKLHAFELCEKYFWQETFLVITPTQLILSSNQVILKQYKL